MNPALNEIVREAKLSCVMKRFLLLVPLAVVLGGCLNIKTHHTVDPIQINVEVNVKVDKALNDFFGDIDKKAADKP